LLCRCPRFKAQLRELLDPKIREHHGRIVKTTGDGLLAEFASVVATGSSSISRTGSPRISRPISLGSRICS
jgi:class 3 adenylate cyclase